MLAIIDVDVPDALVGPMVRAANEGIPVAAIARIWTLPYGAASGVLHNALSAGQIGEMPKADWPPAQKWSCRLPTVPRGQSEAIEFACRKVFRLTPLEAGFMMVLLRYEHADKDKLHGVIEHQRFNRQQRPDSAELTDPKMVDVIVCKLRKKLRAVNPAFELTTSWGTGYYFETPIKDAIYAHLEAPHDEAPASPAAGPAGAAGSTARH